MDPECYDTGCDCRNQVLPPYVGLSEADVRMVEHATGKPNTYCVSAIVRPTDADVKAYQEAHPEIDWTRNEVLYTWNGFGQPMTVESHWSHEDRDAIYAAMVEAGLDPKWFEKDR